MKHENNRPSMSQRELEKRYNEMLKHEMCAGEVDKNRVNVYTCDSCGTQVKTIDVANGVTPMFKGCEKCTRMAHSSFYKDTAPHLNPTMEWYRPTLKQCMKLRSKDEGLLEHILNGGLDIRKLTKKLIKTYTLNWGDGDLILDEIGLKSYLLEGGLFGDEDIQGEPWEATIKVEFKYTEKELREMREFDF